jgi:hypothetical protein
LNLWSHPCQVDHRGPPTSTNRLCASTDRSLRSGLDRCRSRLLVSATGVSRRTRP